MGNDLKITINELLEGGLVDEDVFAEGVISTDGRIVIKYGGSLKVRAFNSQDQLQLRQS
ncbi:hypothetical protein [Photobacterium sp. GB-72]|uniref:hypothetical protein n=1 Tax=Photobacterium sp. GB-72 TaxID=2022105 RepID=UPI001304A573|nr:hypothetical protein [Photobacterium sp. GB-72]